MTKIKRKVRKTRTNYKGIPIYAYSDEGKLVGSYTSRHAFAKEHGVIYAAVTRALKRKGKCAGLRVLTEKKHSLPPIIKKDYPLFPLYNIYRYDLRGESLGVVTETIWNALSKASRTSILHDLKARKTKKVGDIYFSRLNGLKAFSVHSRSVSNKRTRSKGAVIVTFSNGSEHIYPQAADAIKDLGLRKERVSNVLTGKLESTNGYRFRRM